MSLGVLETSLITVVGAGGVGKTTLAAALGIVSARDGVDTLVMTFDPSYRLKDALGVGEDARDRPVRVPLTGAARLDVSLLDARRTFDRLVARYAPDRAASERIFGNRFYHHLAGHLAGVLEYMAVERLFEVWTEGGYGRVILDTPPTRQALDFLEAPDRIVGFLDSGALRIALRPWFASDGSLRRLGGVRRRAAEMLDRIVGLELLRDMAEFFQAFAPLYDGFRARAREVQQLLRRPETRFLLVAAPAEDRIPDLMFFARRLRQGGHHVAALVVNQVHAAYPRVGRNVKTVPGLALLEWLARRDARGLAALRQLVTDGTPVADLPLFATPPTGLPSLEALGRSLVDRVVNAAPAEVRPRRRGRRA